MRGFAFLSCCIGLVGTAASAQDGSGVDRERTKASAQEFFTKATERTKEPIHIHAKRASSTDDFGHNLEVQFPPGTVLSMKSGETDCTTLIKAVYVARIMYGVGRLPFGNPMTSIFARESGGDIEMGQGFVSWADVISVTRAGTELTVKGTWHFRFIFPTEELAERFGQAMEFMRAQCSANADNDLAF